MLPSNFRDCGGLGLSSGRRMTTGRLFRSAAPQANQAKALAARGVAQMVDLRGMERGERGEPFDAESFGLRWLSTPVEPKTSAVIHQEVAAGTASAPKMRALMIETYRAFVIESAPLFGAALTATFTQDRPTLIHCTAGKDRTGFLVAVIQLALGAPHDAVLADYLRTNQDWDRASVKGVLPLGSPALEPVMIADSDYLDAALDAILRLDGDAQGFIARATAGAVTQAHLDALIEQEIAA